MTFLSIEPLRRLVMHGGLKALNIVASESYVGISLSFNELLLAGSFNTCETKDFPRGRGVQTSGGRSAATFGGSVSGFFWPCEVYTLLKMGRYYNTTMRHYWDMLVK